MALMANAEARGTYTRTRACTRKRTHAYAHTRTRERTHAYTHTHKEKSHIASM